MNHFERELALLKESLRDMGDMVRLQFDRSIVALLRFDKNLAEQVLINEKRINAEELKIDRDCESLMALYTPVAVDLRLIFSVFKINAHLERIADHAEGIARYVVELEKPLDETLVANLQVKRMSEIVSGMIADNLIAFELEKTDTAQMVFKKELVVNQLNNEATQHIAGFIRQHPEEVESMINLSSIIRKMERTGDMNTNIAEEIIFYLEAKVLKHQKKNLE